MKLIDKYPASIDVECVLTLRHWSTKLEAELQTRLDYLNREAVKTIAADPELKALLAKARLKKNRL